jgi:hypothetical protein
MFPFKVQLFQGCKSEAEPINTKSILQRVIDTKYCWRHTVQPFQMLIVFTMKHSNPSVYEQWVYLFSLIRDAQINTCFSIYDPVLVHTSSFLS